MRNPNRETTFRFKQFEVSNCHSAMKVGTDGVLLGAWAFADSPTDCMCNVLDVGCGTGLIMLMMAQRFNNAIITGVEIDASAAYEAVNNCSNSLWNNRLTVLEQDFMAFASICHPGIFDLIISNPPFFSNGAVAPDLSRNIARHEGWLNVESLISTSARLLAADGLLAMVVPFEHYSRIEFQAAVSGLALHRVCEVRPTDKKAPRRLLCELQKSSEPHIHSMKKEELIIRENGMPSAHYVSLVEDFYTKIS